MTVRYDFRTSNLDITLRGLARRPEITENDGATSFGISALEN